MSLKIKLIGAAILIPASTYYTAHVKKKRIAKYQISSIEQPLMDACSRAMSGEKVTFAKGANTGDGCACMAKSAAAEYQGDELAEYQKISVVVMELGRASHDAKSQAETQKFEQESQSVMINLAVKSTIDMDRFLAVGTSVGEDLNFCGERKNHRGEAMTRIAELRPLGAPAMQASAAPAVTDEKPAKPKSAKTQPVKAKTAKSRATEKPNVRMRLRGSAQSQSASNNE